MYVMQVHARIGWVSVVDLEKMLHKVRWALGEVSLYIGKYQIISNDLYTHMAPCPCSYHSPMPIHTHLGAAQAVKSA